MQSSPSAPSRSLATRAIAYRPAALVIGGMLIGSTFFSGLFKPSEVIAQDKVQPENILNAAEQRKTMNANLVAINDRLGRIEAQLKTGISVKVTEMLAVKDKDAPKK